MSLWTFVIEFNEGSTLISQVSATDLADVISAFNATDEAKENGLLKYFTENFPINVFSSNWVCIKFENQFYGTQEMLELILLTVVGVGAATMIGSDGNDQIDGEDEGEDLIVDELDPIVEEDEPVVDEVQPIVEEVDPIVEDELVGDTGATLVFDEETNVLSIEVGEDETGTLAFVRSDVAVGAAAALRLTNTNCMLSWCRRV